MMLLLVLLLSLAVGVAEFAGVRVTGIDVSGVFVVGLVDVGAVGFSFGLNVGGVVRVDVVACFAFVAGVGVVLGVAKFAGVGVTGIDVSGVFVVGLDGVDLVDVGAVWFSVGLYVGGVGVVGVS